MSDHTEQQLTRRNLGCESGSSTNRKNEGFDSDRFESHAVVYYAMIQVRDSLARPLEEEHEGQRQVRKKADGFLVAYEGWWPVFRKAVVALCQWTVLARLRVPTTDVLFGFSASVTPLNIFRSEPGQRDTHRFQAPHLLLLTGTTTTTTHTPYSDIMRSLLILALFLTSAAAFAPALFGTQQTTSR